ncbi:carboxypeptidase-like regulatory domain-containing protein [Chryseobacterium sp. ES2]|uniref:Carboxypeptidase-like regulatory domain-containing protein n=1 Tax=Chryseobacterium metallicongregator TaxID=3073042 RepID=A0ABU1E525_9FLAO|nr:MULTISPECIES: carboxypeptidase-like regulatory domain-containing protein [Chryseobacterium]MDR4952856.1 carboxypeptidase-like regulatory domain-containing protein [Chryseobacterium sp. ES2]
MAYTTENIEILKQRKIFLFLLLLCSTFVFSQQKVTGRIVDDNGENLSKVIVINMSTDKKVYSDSEGIFSIEANPNDELRFVKEEFNRVSRRVLINGNNLPLFITLRQIPRDVGEVKIVKKLTGDLETDSRIVAKVDKGEQVRDAVGLPQPVGKMREKPAEVKSVLLPILLGNLNVQGVYDLISGKARRQKRQYRYDDLQEHIAWVRDRIDDEYFIKAGIPGDRISEFIQFSFLAKPQVRTYVKARNLSGVMLRLEETAPLFIERMQQNQK